MHKIQATLIEIARERNLGRMSFGDMTEELEHRLGQKIHRQQAKYHFEELLRKNLLTGSKQSGDISPSIGKESSLLFSIPIMGNANCGQALEIAEDKVQEYFPISKRLIALSNPAQLERVFGVRAVGSSMNDAHVGVKRKPINDGDIVLIDPQYGDSFEDKYMVTVIDGSANIKRVSIDQQNERIILQSESTEKYSDIYLHPDDLEQVTFSGEVVDVVNL